MPVMNLLTMKPPATGDMSYGLKLGKDLPDIMRGGLFPSNSICPSKQDICMVFTVEPAQTKRFFVLLNRI